MADVVVKGLTEETFEDAACVIRAAFSDSVARWAHKFLSNPLRKICPSAGDISYKDGAPMAFQAAILRRMYLGKTPYLGVTGSTFCKMPKAKPRYVLAVFEKTEESRGGSVMTFGNTAVPITQSIADLSGTTFGPESCAKIRFAVLRAGGFLNIVLRGRIPKSIVAFLNLFSLGKVNVKGLVPCKTFATELFDSFWGRYLEGNRGLVLSRTAEELNWAFGEEVRSGNALVYYHVHQGIMDGYIIFKKHPDGTGLRWMVADWIALNDDVRILNELLSGGLAWLKADTAAALVELIGYPLFVQGVVRRCMPFSRAARGNCATYRFTNRNVGEAFEKVKANSWFFGAYDGDRAL